MTLLYIYCTVCSPHPPYIPAWKHLQKYWEHRSELFVSPSFYNQTEMDNSDYKRITTQIPEYGNETYVRYVCICVCRVYAICYMLYGTVNSEQGKEKKTSGHY